MEKQGVSDIKSRRKLLQNLEIVQNGQHQTDGEIQADQTADSTDDSANQRNVGQNADQHTGNSIHHQMDDDVDYQSGNIHLGLECQGEVFFEHIHEMYHLGLDDIRFSITSYVGFCNIERNCSIFEK